MNPHLSSKSSLLCHGKVRGLKCGATESDDWSPTPAQAAKIAELERVADIWINRRKSGYFSSSQELVSVMRHRYLLEELYWESKKVWCSIPESKRHPSLFEFLRQVAMYIYDWDKCKSAREELRLWKSAEELAIEDEEASIKIKDFDFDRVENIWDDVLELEDFYWAAKAFWCSLPDAEKQPSMSEFMREVARRVNFIEGGHPDVTKAEINSWSVEPKYTPKDFTHGTFEGLKFDKFALVDFADALEAYLGTLELMTEEKYMLYGLHCAVRNQLTCLGNTGEFVRLHEEAGFSLH